MSQFTRNWMQSIFTQTPIAQGLAQPGESTAQAMRGTKRPSSTEIAANHEPDDISKSLSLFLSQQLIPSEQQAGNSSLYPDMSGAKELSAMVSANSGYNPMLTDMLDIGYDTGGRRVISMPNPLGNLSFEIPINPPVQPALSMPIMSQSLLDKAPMAYGLTPNQYAFTGSRMQFPQQRQVSAHAMFGPTCTVEGLLNIHAKTCSAESLLGMTCSTETAPALVAGALDGHTQLSGDSRLTDSSSPDLPISQQLSPQLSSAHVASGPNRRVPLPKRRIGTHTTAPSPAVTMDDISGLGTSCASTPLLGSTSSTLLPHRVDRQLAAAGARPLLFVRPNAKGSQSRRRKRRCVSPVSAFPAHPDTLAGLEASNNQWQRISEQRRRDAMRENFDLLKRMLPQAYMDSDDGRELARPVLLSRFLRWVDDTLIEMENLKTEVARLRIQNGDAGLHTDIASMPTLPSAAPMPLSLQPASVNASGASLSGPPV
ncbi:hypothetical protein IW141_001340 [Coemansia sp. RSA 355]|nr:hypothetical protein IW141_001340 [Coemansia sp. RSA 355]